METINGEIIDSAKEHLSSTSTQHEIASFFNSRIPTLEEGMPLHSVLGHIALYVSALELQLQGLDGTERP